MRVALLGAGRIGRVHAPNIAAHPRSSLAAVVDPIQDAAQELADTVGARVMSEDEMFADPSIDAVLIASSTHRHADQIEKAASSKKAILCEKPIDLDISRVRDVESHLKEHPVPMMLGFNRRFDPNFQTLKAQIDNGTIGNVEMVTILSRDPGLPPIDYIKVSGGLFRDMMIHDLDVARWLVGETFDSVSAMGSVLVDPAVGEAGDVDTAVVTLKTKSGKLVSITNSRRARYGYDQRIEVHGSKGLVAAENMRETTVITATESGVRLEKPMHFFLERYAQAYRNEWDAFVRFVLDGDKNVPGIEDGIASLDLADRCVALVKP
ncbi:MAG: inositol 2-dehydrogenase [Pseudomonadota bacterium]